MMNRYSLGIFYREMTQDLKEYGKVLKVVTVIYGSLELSAALGLPFKDCVEKVNEEKLKHPDKSLKKIFSKCRRDLKLLGRGRKFNAYKNQKI